MAQGFQLEGKIHQISEIQTFASGFSKREFVVETMDGQYPQMIKFECVKERTAMTDGLNQGDPVNVHFDIRGNEYQGKYYVNLNCWKLDRVGAQQPGAPAPQAGEPYPQEAPAGHFDESQEDIPYVIKSKKGNGYSSLFPIICSIPPIVPISYIVSKSNDYQGYAKAKTKEES